MLLTALWLGRLAEARLMNATSLESNLRVMFSKLVQVLLLLAAFLIALPAVGIDLTVLSVFGGMLGVGIGFGLAMLVGIPLGLWMGWVAGAYRTFNPIFQMLRPISPIAWIPLAILWFGVGDVSPIFLIFISSVFPLIVQTTSGVHTIDRRYLRAAANFGVSRSVMFRRVVIPAVLPEIIIGMRIGIGVAFMFGLGMDVHQSSLLGQHALSYTALSFFATMIHRRLLWFSVPSQALQVLPLFAVAHGVEIVIRLIGGGSFPGWPILLAPVFEAVLWPVVSVLLLVPQRRAPNPDENRPL
eukprot:gene46418-56845_t